jgi:hypothetical protein
MSGRREHYALNVPRKRQPLGIEKLLLQLGKDSNVATGQVTRRSALKMLRPLFLWDRPLPERRSPPSELFSWRRPHRPTQCNPRFTEQVRSEQEIAFGNP